MANYPGVRDFTGGDTLLASHLDEMWTAFQALFPVGFIMYSVAAATTSENFINACWLECNGVSVLRADYPSLNTLLSGLSYPFGTADGTHFTLPDLRGRTIYAMASSGHADVNALGDSDGYSTLSTRTPKHNSTTNQSVSGNVTTNVSVTVTDIIGGGSTNAGGSTSIVTSSNPGSGNRNLTANANATSNHSLSLSGTVGPGSTRPVDVVPYLVAGSFFIKAVA